mmetsp:Transcript_61887/g.109978  ORF Transcript_61887/g.109978 Transcript_61887/m.109978 type:complete len:489 (+) Transcript_61887:49-1515(+)
MSKRHPTYSEVTKRRSIYSLARARLGTAKTQTDLDNVVPAGEDDDSDSEGSQPEQTRRRQAKPKTLFQEAVSAIATSAVLTGASRAAVQVIEDGDDLSKEERLAEVANVRRQLDELQKKQELEESMKQERKRKRKEVREARKQNRKSSKLEAEIAGELTELASRLNVSSLNANVQDIAAMINDLKKLNQNLQQLDSSSTASSELCKALEVVHELIETGGSAEAWRKALLKTGSMPQRQIDSGSSADSAGLLEHVKASLQGITGFLETRLENQEEDPVAAEVLPPVVAEPGGEVEVDELVDWQSQASVSSLRTSIATPEVELPPAPETKVPQRLPLIGLLPPSEPVEEEWPLPRFSRHHTEQRRFRWIESLSRATARRDDKGVNRFGGRSLEAVVAWRQNHGLRQQTVPPTFEAMWSRYDRVIQPCSSEDQACVCLHCLRFRGAQLSLADEAPLKSRSRRCLLPALVEHQSQDKVSPSRSTFHHAADFF